MGRIGVRNPLEDALEGVAELHGVRWGEHGRGLIDTRVGVVHYRPWAPGALWDYTTWSQFEMTEVLNLSER
jgi:hypothetical protein